MFGVNTVPCPYCLTAILNDGSSAGLLVACPACGHQFNLPAEPLVAKIRMVSGIEHQCTAVLMFDVVCIRQAEAIRQGIERNFAGFRTGLGFIGSFSSVVIRSLALGMVESAVSQQMTKQGMGQLEDYYQACIRVRNSGQFIELNQIDNIRAPLPATWRVTTGPALGGFLLFDDPFVAIQTKSKTVSIMWDKVEDYIVERDV